MENPATINEISPVLGSQRVVSLDVLRGFAVLGILVMNIQSFSMVGAAYSNPHAFGELSSLNYAVWYLSHLLADLKFMGLFSLLFGAGIIVMTERREERGLPTVGFHYRRTFWLLLFGLVHAYAIWYGDILVVYSMSAAVIFWARRLSPRWLITLAILMLSVASGLYLVSGLSMPYWPEDSFSQFKQQWVPDDEAVAKEIAMYRGSWREQLSHRVPLAAKLHTFLFLFLFLWRAGGVMLLGMALYKLSILDASRSRSFYAKLAVGGLAVGLPTIAYGVWQNNAHEWDVKYSFFIGSQYNYWGSVPTFLGYVGLIMLACKSKSMNWLTRRLAKTGQMAFTNYLSQSVICTFIFYGHGLGRFGTFSRVQQIGLVVLLFLFQVGLSNWWLSKFRFGPLEWLWRSLSYWHPQPMLLPDS